VDWNADPDWEWHSAAGGLLIDMIEEYARHVGHADLIRESVDGLTERTQADNRLPAPRLSIEPAQRPPSGESPQRRYPKTEHHLSPFHYVVRHYTDDGSSDTFTSDASRAIRPKGRTVSPASDMGPSVGRFRQLHGTVLPPVMGPGFRQ
jgi:hypothetical protein